MSAYTSVAPAAPAGRPGTAADTPAVRTSSSTHRSNALRHRRITRAPLPAGPADFSCEYAAGDRSGCRGQGATSRRGRAAAKRAAAGVPGGSASVHRQHDVGARRQRALQQGRQHQHRVHPAYGRRGNDDFAAVPGAIVLRIVPFGGAPPESNGTGGPASDPTGAVKTMAFGASAHAGPLSAAAVPMPNRTTAVTRPRMRTPSLRTSPTLPFRVATRVPSGDQRPAEGQEPRERAACRARRQMCGPYVVVATRDRIDAGTRRRISNATYASPPAGLPSPRATVDRHGGGAGRIAGGARRRRVPDCSRCGYHPAAAGRSGALGATNDRGSAHDPWRDLGGCQRDDALSLHGGSEGSQQLLRGLRLRGAVAHCLAGPRRAGGGRPRRGPQRARCHHAEGWEETSDVWRLAALYVHGGPKARADGWPGLQGCPWDLVRRVRDAEQEPSARVLVAHDCPMSRIGRPIREVTYVPLEEPVPRPVRLPAPPAEPDRPLEPARTPGRPAPAPEQAPTER